MTSRFFHALVVVGAAISATACGGKSESANGDDAAGTGAGGGGGTAAGGAGGGGGTTGGTGGTLVLGGMGGTHPTGPFPEPGPTAQWDCRGVIPTDDPTQPMSLFQECVDVLGVTAARLVADCPVDPTLAKSAADCKSNEIFNCLLAVTVDGAPVLVNCTCDERNDPYTCNSCYSLDYRNGPSVSCTPELKICECAYTGILR